MDCLLYFFKQMPAVDSGIQEGLGALTLTINSPMTAPLLFRFS